MPMQAPKNTFNKEYVSVNDYKDVDKIRGSFPACSSLNDPNFDVDSIKKAEFFILRSSNDDNLHKAIKYGIWASSFRNSQTLQHTFSNCKRDNIPIYLFYTVVTSDQYSGVAEMVSDVEFSKSFNYWWEEQKWSGIMNIKWHQIKDVHYNNMADLKEDNKSVTALRDGTRLSFENGIAMLKAFKKNQTKTSIFDDFAYMDQREEHLRMERDLSAMMQKTYSQFMGGNANEQSGQTGHPGRRENHHGGHRKAQRNKRKANNNGDRDRDRDVYYKKRET